MDKHLKAESSLSEERKNQIAHAVAEYYLCENFHFMSNGDYRRKLGNAAQTFKATSEELHEFILSKFPQLIGEMFGWDGCSLTGRAAR